MWNLCFPTFSLELIALFSPSKFFIAFSGQTGAGKTYTTIGSLESQEKFGILPRVIEALFDELNNTKPRKHIYISFYEVYNDKVYNTFNKLPGRESVALNIAEDINGNIDIPDLIRLRINSSSEAFSYLSKALKVFPLIKA